MSTVKCKPSKVEFWDDERDIGNGIIVTLQYGWSFESSHEGVRGFDSPGEAWEAIGDAIPCRCQECLQH